MTTWIELAKRTARRRERTKRFPDHAVLDITEVAAELLTQEASSPRRSDLPADSELSYEKSVFGSDIAVETKARVMCWPAEHGDAYSLTITHLRNAQQRLHFIIDGGLKGPFAKFLWPQIGALYKQGHPTVATVLTHIDADHITGLQAWAEFNTEQTEQPAKRRLPHASIVNVPMDYRNWEPRQPRQKKRSPSQLKSLIEGYMAVAKAETPITTRAYRGEVLACDRPGNTNDLEHLTNLEVRLDWEAQFGVKVEVINPDSRSVARDYDEDKLTKEKRKKKKVTLANRIGIVLLFTVKGARLLFCGDALGSDILEGLESSGLLPREGQAPEDRHISANNPLALLTVPHHGSKYNSTREFFNRLPAKIYTISTSGGSTHHHPDREVLDLLAQTIQASSVNLRPIKVHFTYADAMRPAGHARVAEFKRRLGVLAEVTCSLETEREGTAAMKDKVINIL